MSEMNGALDLTVATWYLLNVDTTSIPHSWPAAFRSESVIDLQEFEYTLLNP